MQQGDAGAPPAGELRGDLVGEAEAEPRLRHERQPRAVAVAVRVAGERVARAAAEPQRGDAHAEEAERHLPGGATCEQEV